MKTYATHNSRLLRATCRKWKIDKLALFGSALRDDFRPDSDVDLVVSFKPDAHWGLWDFYALREELQGIFNREVDLVEQDGIINPIRRRNILNSMRVIYAAN